MLSIKEIPIFFNEKFVDELWVRLKREGLTIEKVKEASDKVAAKGTLGGLGKLWSLVLPDIGAELSGEHAIKRTEKQEIGSMLRGLLMPELIPDLAEIPNLNRPPSFNDLSQGVFARITCDNIAMTPLPTFAAFARQLFLDNLNEQEEDEKMSPLDLLKVVDTVFGSNRALTLLTRTKEGKMGAPALVALMKSESDEIHNALSVCNDDLMLVASSIQIEGRHTVVFAVLEEEFVNRSLVAFIGKRPVTFFGQIAYLKLGPTTAFSNGEQANFIGIRSATITLC